MCRCLLYEERRVLQGDIKAADSAGEKLDDWRRETWQGEEHGPSEQWLELTLGMHAMPGSFKTLLPMAATWRLSILNSSNATHVVLLLRMQRQKILSLRTVWTI